LDRAGALEGDSTVSELNMTQEYSKRVGERIRSIRRQKRLSLQEVEASSNQEFKASVLGAYERGERAISVPRLQRLSRLYNVPADQLLPADAGPSFGVNAGGEGAAGLDDRPGRPAVDPITIDLTQLASLSGPEAEMLTQYLTTIQVQRQDFNGRVLTVREQDRLALTAILGVSLDGVAARLESLGLSYQP
jgi:transcriptional regulator with XRE-family HTH domain